MKLNYYVKNVYGNLHLYLESSTEQQAITSLTGTKTLLQTQMQALESLGFEFVQVLTPSPQC